MKHNSKYMMADGKAIGVINQNRIGYFHRDLPDTPFSNFYEPKDGIKIYVISKNGKQCLSPFKQNSDRHGTFHSVEQFFAYSKALLMHDGQMANKIYHLPKNTKAVTFRNLGRQVKNYDDAKWNKYGPKFMKIGMLAKFSQDEFAKKCLKATKDKELVECNPYDHKWGIGMNVDSDFSSKTNGFNLQGKMLMETRERLFGKELEKHKSQNKELDLDI